MEKTVHRENDEKKKTQKRFFKKTTQKYKK